MATNEEKHAGTELQDEDLLKVLLALEERIMRDLKVAAFGVVKSIKEDQYYVQFFPLLNGEMKKNVPTVKACDAEIAVNDIVYVVFADRNFVQNLKQAKRGLKLTELGENSDLHSEKYGVIISKISLEGGQ